MGRWVAVTAGIAGIAAGVGMASGCLGAEYRKVDGAAGAAGAGGAGDCSPFVGVPPQSCDADPARLTDPDNCCVAGRSCLGAGCADGRCEAMQFASSSGSGEAIAVVLFDGQVLWSTGDGGTVLGYAESRTGQIAVIAQDPSYVTAMTADDSYIYWVEYDGSQIRRQDPAMLPGSDQLVADTGGDSGGWGRIALVGEHVYWAAETGGSLWRARKDGSESSAPTLIHRGGVPHGVAADETHVYWTDQADAPDGGVFRLALADLGTGATPERIAQHEGWATDIAVVDGDLYWIDGGAVYRRPTAGGEATELGNSSSGWSLAFDDTFVYWTDEEDDALYRAARRGAGSSRQFLANGVNPKGIALGCRAIYFANYTDDYPNPDWVSLVAK